MAPPQALFPFHLFEMCQAADFRGGVFAFLGIDEVVKHGFFSACE
jgi:hypothetical protein